MHLHPPPAVMRIAARLEEAGFDTWAVGGAVRDAVLGLPAVDWDLATSARPKQVRQLFRRTVPVGIEHGTVGVLGEDDVLYEVTTFRRDVETFGRHAVVEFADTLEEDLARRDFTFNALAWKPSTEELRDPYAGLADLEAGRLRTVGKAADRFAEDYLRVLRALRFAGQFRLTIGPDVWAALTAAASHLAELSAERVHEELRKILTKTRQASVSLELYQAAGVLEVVFPELAAVAALAPAEGSVSAWTLSVHAMDRLPVTRPRVRLAALLHAVGMPAARTHDLRGGWRYTGHETIGAEKTEELLRRLRASNAEIERVGRLVAHQSDLFPPDARGPAVRRWLRRVGPDMFADFWRLRFALWRADPAYAGQSPDDLLERVRAARFIRAQHPPLEVSDLAIGGAELRTLGLPPGPEYGRILRALLEHVLDEPRENSRARLLELVREMLQD